ncbi:hypothetical protein TNCV_4583571 [Trichonephila clavipes]|nr:hypothetical protein TNCV_4583571 [Trichonephila clavipes]
MSDYTNEEYAPHVRQSRLQWALSTENVPGSFSEKAMRPHYSTFTSYHMCYDQWRNGECRIRQHPAFSGCDSLDIVTDYGLGHSHGLVVTVP